MDNTITFRQLYSDYQKEGRVAILSSPVIPICSETKTNIFNQIEMIETYPDKYPHGKSYIAWLNETDDIESLVSYEVYIRDYANDYERYNRARFLKGDRIPAIYGRLNIPKRFWGQNMENMINYEHQKEMVEKAKEYIASGYKGSLLMASRQRGFGKTHLASCIAIQYWIDNGSKEFTRWSGSWSIFNSQVLFLNETELYYLLRATYKTDAQFTEFDIFKWITEDYTKLLILDDIYFVGDKTFVKEVLSRIIHVRVDENMLPTIITSNKTLKVMNGIDQSLTSRLLRGIHICIDPELKTKDLRRQ